MQNTENREAYDKLNNGEKLFAPSYMGIVPKDVSFDISTNYLEKVLNSNKEFKLESVVEQHFDDGVLGYEVNLVYRETFFTALITKLELNKERLTTLAFANQVKESEQNEALAKDHYIDVSIAFGESALDSYLFQLKLMHTIVPQACLGIDYSAYTVFSISWLKMLVEADIPPAPRYLYSIHAVYDDKDGERIYWLHTHGLLRCGSMEIEVVNLKHGAEQVHSLLTYAADKFIEHHYKAREKFQIGYDGMGLFLTWLPWEDVLTDYPDDMLGGLNERREENDAHAGPSGILYAVEDGNELVSTEIYVKTLQDNPIFWISNEETARMRALALSQWDVFARAFAKYRKKEPEKKSFLGKLFGGNKKQDESEWTFMIKLGLVVDKADTENDKEHLWFDVKAIDGDQITGKLLNQPYWIAKLNEGDVVTYSAKEFLTDWMVYGPDQNYTPDSAYYLV